MILDYLWQYPAYVDLLNMVDLSVCLLSVLSCWRAHNLWIG